jgi:hypothetical protein
MAYWDGLFSDNPPIEVLPNPDSVGIKNLAQEIGVPYQTLINLYLRECAATKKKLSLQWKPA